MRGNSFKAHAGEFVPVPLDAPTESAFATPLTDAGINTTWAGYVIGALDVLLLDAAWRTDDMFDTWQQVESLIAYLGAITVREDDVAPTGAVMMWVSDTPPEGWLLCDGSAVSRSTYNALFSVVGVAFGSGDGATTFNLPDVRGRFPLGQDDMGGSSANRVTDASADSVGGSGGSEEVTLATADIPDIRVGALNGAGGTPLTTRVPGGSSFSTGDANVTLKQSSIRDTSGNTPAGGAHNNMPPYVVLNFIIKT